MSNTSIVDFDISIEQINDTVQCPICGDYSAGYYDVFEALSNSGWEASAIENTIRYTTRMQTFKLADGNRLAIGCFCPDAMFGDECPACGNHVLNTETAAIGPNGYCHADDGSY